MLALAPFPRGSSRGRAAMPGRPVGLARQVRSGRGGRGCLPRRCTATPTSVVVVARGDPVMASTLEQRAAREAKLDELHEKLTGAVEQLVSGDDWRDALAFAARFRSRSFNNTMLIWVQHQVAFEVGRVPEPFPSLVAGYRQWQGLGRQVMKGQPGYMIFAPVTGRFATATPSDSGSWRRLGPREKPKPGEVVRSRMVGARPAYVWDVSQTDGEPLPTMPAPVLLEGEAPAGLWDGLAAQIRAAGFEVVSVPDEMAIMGANGMTDYDARTVSVRENMPAAARVKTLAHELAHVMMHDPDDVEVRQHRGIREVEAESVALMIGAAHGMTTDGYTIPYVSTWAVRADDKEPAQIVQATGERVRQTALAILDQLDTPQLGDGTPPGLERDIPAAKPARAAARMVEPDRPHTTPVVAGWGL